MTSHARSALRCLLFMGLLGGFLLCSPPTPGHAQQTGQQIVKEQNKQQEELVRTVLGNITGQDLTQDEEEEKKEQQSSSSSSRVSIPSIPRPDDIGAGVRTTVRNNLRSSCSQRCSNVYQSKLRTCDITPSPQECANRARSNLQLCRVQCN